MRFCQTFPINPHYQLGTGVVDCQAAVIARTVKATTASLSVIVIVKVLVTVRTVHNRTVLMLLESMTVHFLEFWRRVKQATAEFIGHMTEYIVGMESRTWGLGWADM